MTNAFYRIVLKFAQEVGMENLLTQSVEIQSIEILTGAILVIAIISCFFGFKLFRLCGAVMAFFLTAIGICEMLRSTAHMGVIVITFAIVGLIAAFLAYQWYKISVFFICAMIGYSIATVFTGNIWICISMAIVLGAVSVLFASVVVILSTTIWGAFTFGFTALSYIGVNLLVYKILVPSVLAAAGLFTQYSMNEDINLIPVKGWSITGMPQKIFKKSE